MLDPPVGLLTMDDGLLAVIVNVSDSVACCFPEFRILLTENFLTPDLEVMVGSTYEVNPVYEKKSD